MAMKKKSASVVVARRAGGAAQKKLIELKARSVAQRARARASQSDQRAALGAIGAAAAAGYAYKQGYLARIPRLGGMPTTITLGVVGLGVGYYAGGTLGDVGRAVAIACGCVAAYQLASGLEIAGDSDSDVRRAVERLATQLNDGNGFSGDEVDVHERPIPMGMIDV